MMHQTDNYINSIGSHHDNCHHHRQQQREVADIQVEAAKR